METISIPGWGSLCVKNLVLDLNGTITESGRFLPGVRDRLEGLRRLGLHIFILSGDTRGTLKETFGDTSGIQAVVSRTAQEKRAFVESIGAEQTVCIGNGNIDVEMFKVAALSICTVQAEGASTKALLEADIVVTHVNDGLEILADPARLVATLRA